MVRIHHLWESSSSLNRRRNTHHMPNIRGNVWRHIFNISHSPWNNRRPHYILYISHSHSLCNLLLHSKSILHPLPCNFNSRCSISTIHCEGSSFRFQYNTCMSCFLWCSFRKSYSKHMSHSLGYGCPFSYNADKFLPPCNSSLFSYSTRTFLFNQGRNFLNILDIHLYLCYRTLLRSHYIWVYILVFVPTDQL